MQDFYEEFPCNAIHCDDDPVKSRLAVLIKLNRTMRLVTLDMPKLLAPVLQSSTSQCCDPIKWFYFALRRRALELPF